MKTGYGGFIGICVVGETTYGGGGGGGTIEGYKGGGAGVEYSCGADCIGAEGK
jgi:hypothetical protein